MKRWLVLVLSVALTFGGAGTALAEAGPEVPAPQAMAALGDSITRAFHSNCGLLNDCPENSWSTGSAVDSHAVRIGNLTGSTVQTDNLAVTGAVAADIATQASGIASDTDFVTILVGANDACTDTVSQMTSVSDFTADIDAALDAIFGKAPNADVYLVSIPDLYRLWEVGSASGSARFTWWLYGICQSMLQSPRSTQQADVERRQIVRQRVIDFNAALATECATYAGTCHYDGGAVFGYPFVLSQLSTIDYFHPNVAGQQVLASVTWNAGYTWTTGEPPPNNPPIAEAGPDQTVTADGSGMAQVTLDGSGSSDPDGDTLTYSWTWDGGSSSGMMPTIVLGADTTVTLTVDDGNGGSDSDTVTVFVDPSTPPPTVTVHIGDLDAASNSAPRNRWEATVTVTVHTASEAGLAGVSVTGTWSDAARGSGSCVTDGSGSCTVVKANLKGNNPIATFTVTQVEAVDVVYDTGANHDPDGDSDGTSIIVTKP